MIGKIRRVGDGGKMHHIKGLDYSRAKVSATIKIEGFDGDVRYVASKVTEVYTFISTDDREKLGHIYVRKNNQKQEGSGNMTVLKVNGVMPEKWLRVADENTHKDVKYTVEQDDKAVGSVQKPSGLKWRDVVLTTGEFDVTKFVYTPISETTLRRLKDLSWLQHKDYRVLRTKEEIDSYINLLMSLPKDTYIGLDTETTGLRVNKNKIDSIVGMSISHKEDFGVYIPLDQKYGGNSEYSIPEVMEKLRPIVDKHESTAKPLVLHNAKFDWKVFKQNDIELNVVKDTFIMMGLINYAEGRLYDYDYFIEHYTSFGYDEDVMHDVYYKNQIAGNHRKARSDVALKDLPQISAYRQNGLKGSIEHFFNIDVLELTDMFEKKTAEDYRKVIDLVDKGASIDEITYGKLKADIRAKDNGKKKRVTPFDFRYAPQWFYEVYGSADGDFPLMLLRVLTEKGGDWEKLDGALDTTEQIELATIETLGEQEYYGIKIIVPEINRLGDEAEAELADVVQSIYEEVGFEFNINSNKDLADVLYNKLGVPKLDSFKTKTGALGVGKSVLDQVATMVDDEGNAKFPIVKKLKRHSALSKELSAFYRALPDLADTESYLNPSYKSLGAGTGRISCNDPNVQQMHPSVRSYIVPDTDEYYFAVDDFSQVERRLMGGLSGEPAINERFIEDKEADSHKQTYASMYNYPYEKVNGSKRKIGKTLNFASAYGITKQGLSVQLYNSSDETHQALAQDLLDTYDKSVPVYKKFIAVIEKKAKETLFAETYFGRRRHIEEFDSKYYMPTSASARESAGDRAAGNMVVQGTAADILKLAMARLRASWRRHGYDESMAVMKMNVHDEVTYQLHKSIHPAIATYIMKTAMEVDLSKQGFPPLYVGMNLGNHWKDGKRDDLEAPVILMDELAEEGKRMLELPLDQRPVFTEDPVTYWQNKIIAFSARELTKEVQNGYLDSETNERHPFNCLTDTHKNVRIPSYSDYFGELVGTANYPSSEGFTWFNDDNDLQNHLIIWALILKDDERLTAKHQDIMLGEEPKEELVRAINTAIKGEADQETSVLLGWFKDYGEGLKEADSAKTVIDYTFDTNGLTVIYEDSSSQSIKQDGEYQLRTGGDEVDDSYVSPKEQLAQSLTFSGNVIKWEMPENDEEVLGVLNTITIDSGLLEEFGIPVDTCSSLRVILSGGSVLSIKGWVVPEVKPVLGRILLAYYSGLTYDFVENELNKIADKIFK